MLINETLNDDERASLRSLLINADATLLNATIERETLTRIALDFSLCPLHLIDYAICFDDDDAECAMIRLIHPTHDT